MPIREVALSTDVRAPRLWPSRASVFSIYFVRRVLSVMLLLGIDISALLLAILAQSRMAGRAAPWLWSGFTLLGVSLSCGVIVVCAAFCGLYGRRHTRHCARSVIVAWTVAFAVSLVLMLAADPDGLGARLVAVWLLAFALSFSSRWIFDALLGLRYGADGDCPRALLLGSLDSCRLALPTLLTLPPRSRVAVVGLVVPDGDYRTAPGGFPAGSPAVVGSPDALPDALRRCRASELILADPLSINGQLRRVMDVCRSSRVALKVFAAELQLDGHAVTYMPGLDCPLFVVRPRPAGWGNYVVKRVLDRVVALLLLVVVSPLLLAIAALIRLTSRGPALFVSQRVGVDQRPFRFYKFRTMTADALHAQRELETRNEAGAVLFKIRDDPRITRVGRVLRRLSLDELPQLLNVLKGDMSLVGPRPLPLRDCELMKEWHGRRHVVQPGMTGLWQVSGRSELGFEEMVNLDLRYIETWTLRTDLYILWRTASAVFHSRGAC